MITYTYTTWAKIVELYPRAGEVEATSEDQTDLIGDMSQLFHGYIRMIHKDVLTSPVDAIVDRAVALLCVNELRSRRSTSAEETEFVEYPHFSGKLFVQGIEAHGHINAIRSGAYVLGQDVAEHDVKHPEVIAATANTGAGTAQAYLPHEWKDNKPASIKIEITTAGRVGDNTARYSWFRDNSATASATGVEMSTGWVHLEDELYIRFKDPAQTGNSFAVGDIFTLDVFPPHTASRSTGPREFSVYQS